MTRWRKGEATIGRLLAGGELEAVMGAQADGQPWIAKARRTLASASELVHSDPDSAYILAYDAARFACTAVLSHQGLRPTTAGGHYAVDTAVRDQFGGPFEKFGDFGGNATNSSTRRSPPTASHPPTPQQP